MPFYKVSLRAKDLPGGGLFRTPNPYATLTLYEAEKELGKTEYIFNTKSPDWVKVFYINTDSG